MGLQSFKFATDFLNNLETPVIYVAKKDKTIVNSVSVYDGLRLTFNLNAFQTAEFKIYRDIDGKRQDYFNDFEEEMLILIPGIGWYEIHVETNIAQTGIFKSITATSLECKLCDKRLIDFECNAGEILYDDYVRTIFYDPTNPKGSLLHRILNVAPNWHVGHVDASLASMQRTFDVDDTDVYSFLTGEVSEAFNCLFVFDTFNCTVNAYDLDNYGADTDIFVSMDNLAQNMIETIDQNSIITCYRVNGGDGVYINEVNPNGTNKLYNFEYYLPQMSSDIQTKVIAYNNKYQSLKPQYEDIMLRMQTQVDIIQELNTRLPDSLSSKDWTKYGLAFLDSKQKSFKTQDELYCAQGMNKPESLSYNLYKQNLQDLNDVTAELSVRQGEIDSATALYNSIKSERDALQDQLDMDNWFTEDEWKSLDNYVIEATYDNDNYIVTDLEDDSERFEIERQLYEVAWKDLEKKCRPQYQYSATLANILTIPEFKNFLEYFELGNFIRMETDYDTIVKLRMISFTVDYTNTQTIDVTFSDAVRVHDVYDDAASIQAQANSAAISFKFNKDQYDSTVKQGNFVAQMRKYGLDVATTQIHNAENQNQVWDDTGFTFRKWDDERRNYDPEQIKIINNLIAISDDGFNKSTVTAIGKIPIDDKGNFAWGVNAQVLVSKLVMSENLWIENQSGTYKFDDAGFIASSGKNSVKIQPNQSGELFSIYNGNNKQVYINSDGDVEFAGSLKSASGTFSGLISGGSINLGNGTFTVDNNGNMVAKSGTFSGNGDGLTFQSNATINELSSQIKQTAESISTEITNRQNADIQLSSSITQTAEQISLKVSKGEVSSEISMENSQIVISGDRIIIDSTNFKLSETGGVKASDIYILGGMITGSVIVSENYYERDENRDLILDENGNPIETGEGTIINLVDGASSFAGEYNYAWLDEEAEVHKAKIDLGKGRLVIEDLDKSKKLYYSYEGISTTEDGNDASGVVDFRSGMFGQSKGGTTYSGITVKTKGSPVALLSETNHCIISPRKLQGIMDNSDMATWDKFVFGLWNRYEVDSGGQPDYTQKRDTVRAGNGYIAFGKRKYDESTDEYDYGTILEFGSKNENGGDYGTVYVNDKNNGQGKGKIIASNIPKAVVDVVVTQNESSQITKLVCTLEDGDKENIAVEYDSNGNVTKIGGTTISGWS